jgi:hypothetical protein
MVCFKPPLEEDFSSFNSFFSPRGVGTVAPLHFTACSKDERYAAWESLRSEHFSLFTSHFLNYSLVCP